MQSHGGQASEVRNDKIDLPAPYIMQSQGNQKANGSPSWSNVSRHGKAKLSRRNFSDEILRIKDNAASTIQSAWRRYSIKKQLDLQHDATHEPTNWETFKNKRRYGLLDYDVALIKDKFHEAEDVQNMQNQQKPTSFLKAARGNALSKINQAQHNAAVLIQSFYRGYRVRMDLLILDYAATIIQAYYRSYKVRKIFREIEQEATVIHLGWKTSQETQASAFYHSPIFKALPFLESCEYSYKPLLLFIPSSFNVNSPMPRTNGQQKSSTSPRPPVFREENETRGIPQWQRSRGAGRFKVKRAWDEIQDQPPRTKEIRILEGIGMGPVFQQYAPGLDYSPQEFMKEENDPMPLDNSSSQLVYIYPIVFKSQSPIAGTSDQKLRTQKPVNPATPATHQRSKRKFTLNSNCPKGKQDKVREILHTGEECEYSEQTKPSNSFQAESVSLASYVSYGEPRIDSQLMKEQNASSSHDVNFSRRRSMESSNGPTGVLNNSVWHNPRQGVVDSSVFPTQEKPPNRCTVKYTRNSYSKSPTSQWLNDSPKAVFEQSCIPIQVSQRENKAAPSVNQKVVRYISSCQVIDPIERRLFMIKKYYQQVNRAAAIIQAAWKAYQTRMDLRNQHEAVSKFHAIFHGYKTRKELVDSGVLDNDSWEAKEMICENEEVLDDSGTFRKYPENSLQRKSPSGAGNLNQKVTYSLMFETHRKDETRE